MESPKKYSLLLKENSFIIRKTTRPASGLRSIQIKESPEKRYRDSYKKANDNSPGLKLIFPSNLGLTTTCWCLYDSKVDKQYGFRHNYQRQIASLTKIMTLTLAVQKIQALNLKLNMLIRISETASKMIGTTANLKAGTWITLKDILYGMMLPSGNDAALVLAETIGFFIMAQQKCENLSLLSTIEKIDQTQQNTSNYVSQFIKEMNTKADQLELIHTRFSNPHGLQNALNISSAKDLILLSIHASQNKLIKQIVNSQYKRYEYFMDQYRSDKEIKIWYNTNALLSKGWEGIKTGQTITAGSCLASLKNGIYIVVLNSADLDKRFSETQKLYNWYVELQVKIITKAVLS